MIASTAAVRSGPEKLRFRSGDSELTLQQILGLSLFKDLTRRAEARLRGRSGQGAVVLRRYRAGEVICREGEPGWTAFYLLKTADLIGLRESQAAAADAAEESLASHSHDALSLSAEQRLHQAEELETQGHFDPEQVVLLRTSAWRPAPGELAALRAERELLARGDELERELADSHPQLLALDAPALRQRAATLAPVDGALATKLLCLAECTERRMRAQVSLRKQTPEAAAPRVPGMLGRLTAAVLGRRANPPDALAPQRRSALPSEGAAELPLATLYEGELFGEMSCLHRVPRSATVRAVRDCYVLEFLGVVLELLLTGERFRAELNAVYRSRVLGQHLRAIPLFAAAPDDVIEQLRQRAELITKRPGELLFEEGAPSDSLYVVRTGTVKVYSRASGRVLGYRSRGEVLGDRGMVTGQPRAASCIAYEHPFGEPRERAAPTLNVELVRIDRTLFDEVCSRFPAFREEIVRTAQAGAASRSADQAAMAQNTSRFSALGLNQGRKLMLIDLTRCTACDDCVSACGQVHADGLPRLALGGARFGKYLIPTSCRQCRDPVCLIGCPVGAIHHGSAGQIVIEDFCIGCGLCADQCPYDAIDLGGDGDGTKSALVCDQCATLAGGPQCVQVCPHDAAQRVDASSFFSRTRVT